MVGWVAKRNGGLVRSFARNHARSGSMSSRGQTQLPPLHELGLFCFYLPKLKVEGNLP